MALKLPEGAVNGGKSFERVVPLVIRVAPGTWLLAYPSRISTSGRGRAHGRPARDIDSEDGFRPSTPARSERLMAWK